MIKHWVKLSCLVLCGQLIATACVTENDDDEEGTGGAGGSAGSAGSGGATSTGGSGGSTGGSAGEAPTTTTTTTTSDAGGSGGTTSSGAGGAAGDAGAAGAGGAGEERETSDLVSLEGGDFHEGTKPETSDGYDGGQISEITGPESVTNGGTFTISVTIPGATGDQDFVVAVTGDSGHFTTTATATDGVFNIDISLNAEVDVETVNVSVAPVDDDGDVGEYADIDFQLVETGTGDVKITLAFDQSTDLDLYVVEPAVGDEEPFQISFSNKVSPSGGTLDLDSNPSCNVDGTNIENIFWPTDSAPKGQYLIGVDYYQACVDVTVNYTVTITIGDEVQTIPGSFEASEAGGDVRVVGEFTLD